MPPRRVQFTTLSPINRQPVQLTRHLTQGQKTFQNKIQELEQRDWRKVERKHKTKKKEEEDKSKERRSFF